MNRIYDLHITVDPRTFDKSFIAKPWQIHDIHNVQGMPHLIVSQKYFGKAPHCELKKMSKKLKKVGAKILREKIELHFSALEDIQKIGNSAKTVEIHYKLPKRRIFKVTKKQIDELNTKKMAISFNVSATRPIVSFRFCDQEAYKQCKLDKLPLFAESEEKELVIFDTNTKLDSFWPMRFGKDKRLSPNLFPTWAVL